MDENKNPEPGDCVQIHTGRQWKFEGYVGRVKRTYQTDRSEDIAIVEMDHGYLVRCPLGKLIPRHPMACSED